jgi:hypothetical protein
MPLVGFEPTMPASARPQTYALVRDLPKVQVKNGLFQESKTTTSKWFNEEEIRSLRKKLITRYQC